MFNLNLKNIISILLIVYTPTISALFCYHCQGSDCEKEWKINNTLGCKPYDECVSVFNGFSIVQRGCYTELPDIHQKECNDPYSNNCHICSDNLCNNLGPTKCIECNENNFRCMNHSERISAIRCPLISLNQVNCYFKLYNKNHQKTYDRVERGCLINSQAVAGCKRDLNCNVCWPKPGIACNTKHELTRSFTFYGDLFATGENCKSFFNLIVFGLLVGFLVK